MHFGAFFEDVQNSLPEFCDSREELWYEVGSEHVNLQVSMKLVMLLVMGVKQCLMEFMEVLEEDCKTWYSCNCKW